MYSDHCSSSLKTRFLSNQFPLLLFHFHWRQIILIGARNCSETNKKPLSPYKTLVEEECQIVPNARKDIWMDYAIQILYSVILYSIILESGGLPFGTEVTEVVKSKFF